MLKASPNSEPWSTSCNISIEIHIFHSCIHPVTNQKIKSTILSKSVDRNVITDLPSLQPNLTNLGKHPCKKALLFLAMCTQHYVCVVPNKPVLPDDALTWIQNPDNPLVQSTCQSCIVNEDRNLLESWQCANK